MSKITTNLTDGILTIQILIDPVAPECAALREGILGQLNAASDYHAVQLDLRSVKMLDSSGIGVIIATYNTLKAKEVELQVVGASADIASLLNSMGLSNHFQIETQANNS